MNAPVKHGPKNGSTYSQRARERWGTVPDWVVVLALRCDTASSQGEVGRQLDLQASVISAVIGKTYPGRYDVIEAKVRGGLMNAKVDCPVLGEIARNDCAGHQQAKFSTSNPTRAQIHRACRAGCPNYLGGNLAKS